MKKYLTIFIVIVIALGAIAVTNSILSFNVKIDNYPHQHEYDEGVVLNEASCSSYGLLKRTCFCGDELEEEILKVLHTVVDGVCSSCGASISEVEISITDLVDTDGNIHDRFYVNLQTVSECTWSDYCTYKDVADAGSYVNDLNFVVLSVNGYLGFLKDSGGVYVTGDQVMSGNYTFVYYGESDTSRINPSLLATYWFRFSDGQFQYAYPYLEGATVTMRKSLNGFGWVDGKTLYVYFPTDRIVVDRDYTFTALVK